MNSENKNIEVPEIFEPIQRFDYTKINDIKIFENDTISKLVCYPPARQNPPSYQTLPIPTEDEKNLLLHYSSAQGIVSDIGLYFCSNARVRGSGYVVKSGRRLYGPDLIPGYIEDAIVKGDFDQINNGIPRTEHHISRPAALLCHEGYLIYGHWLVDIIPKAWMFFSQYGKIPEDILFPFCDDTPSYGLKMLETVFNIRHDQILSYNNRSDELCIERLIVPSMMHNDHIFHPAAVEAMSYVRRKVIQQERGSIDSLPNKIYVSRQKFRNKSISSKRVIDNEDELTSIAQSQGFEIIYPEDYSWPDQVRLFSNAKFIVGEAGSGMHNTIFAGSDAHILSICDSRLQGTLAALLGQQITLIGHKEAHWEGNTIHFNISAERFDSALKIMQGEVQS